MVFNFLHQRVILMNLEVLIVGRREFTRTWRRNDENNDDYKGLLYSASSRPRGMSRILPNKRSKELRDRFETTSKHKYIESLYDSIDSQMIEQFILEVDLPQRV